MTEGVRWFAVLIAATAAVATGLLMSFVEPAYVPLAKGGGAASPVTDLLPSALMLAGMVGMVVGAAGIARSRPSWRRLSVVSVACGALAWLLAEPFVGFPALGYVGIWLGGLLSLLAIGTAVGALNRPKRNKSLDITLAVLGLVAGLPIALFSGWILVITVGGGLGD